MQATQVQHQLSQKIGIVPLSEIQFEQWLLLWQGYQQFYWVQLSNEVTRQTWSKLTDPQRPYIYGFAAVYQTKVVAIVHVIEHDSCWTLKPYAYLQDLYTLPDYRGIEIARLLIAQVYHTAQQRECDRVYWLTHEDNLQARQLYDRVAKRTGFIQYRSPTVAM